MSLAVSTSRYIRLQQVRDALWIPSLVSLAYFVGAEGAFFIGTLSDKLFAPFWPPNVILFCALLLSPVKRWGIFIAAVLPAHMIAELSIGMTAVPIGIAFATNCLIAIANAIAVRHFIGDSDWFVSLRRVSGYIFLTALCCPALAALAGAFVPVFIRGTFTYYWHFWALWYASNALGTVSLGPLLIMLLKRKDVFGTLKRNSRAIEAVATIGGLILTSLIAFQATSGSPVSGYLPALLYLPLPLVLWGAARFGVAGASGSVLIVGAVLLWRALNGATVFNAGDADENVFALQLFLIALSVPALLLSAATAEMQQAERQTRESVDRMAFAAASANVGLWIYTVADRTLWTTDYAASLLGVPANRPLTMFEFYRALQRSDADALARIREAVETRGSMDIEFRLADSPDKARWINIRGIPHRDAVGNTIELAGSLADVTLRKEAEHDAKLQQQEITHLLRISVVGELAGGLAHELTQPLTAIMANAQAAQLELARENPNTGELQDILEDIVTENSRAGDVIHGLRKLLKKDVVRRETIDLNELVKSTLTLIHNEYITRRIRVEQYFTPHLPNTIGDRVQLQQVLLNLLLNAMDATEDLPDSLRAISISTERTYSGDSVEVQIRDQGTGLPAAGADVFKPFFTTKKHGLGLGLSISRSIVSAHSGTLTLENNSSKGATARLRLPMDTQRTELRKAGSMGS